MITLARMLDDWRSAAAVASEPARRICLATLFGIESVEAPLHSAAGELPSLDIANALACAGRHSAVPAIAGALPSTPHGALAALALQGPDAAARLQPAVAGTPRVGDLAATVHHAITCVREGRDINTAFLAWHALVASCADGEADVAMLFWMARVVVHAIGGKPLDSIARWMRDTLEKAARVQEHTIATDRERARIELLDDPDRRAATPEHRLHAWQRSATPLTGLVDVPLGRLGVEVARSVLVDPNQVASARMLERLIAAAPTDPAERASVLDGLLALACIGGPCSAELRDRVQRWLPALEHATPRDRVRAALAALAVSALSVAARIVPVPGDTYVGGRVVTNNIVAATATIVAAVRAHAVIATLDRQLDRIVEELDTLCTTDQLDEATVLWLARAVFVDLDRRSPNDVAAAARDWLFGAAERLTAARRDAVSRARTPPLDRTLDGGRFRIDRWIRGTGAQRLYRGVETANGQLVAIAFDDHAPARQSVDDLRAALAGDAPGILELAFVGAVDDDRDHWAIVEHLPAHARWLPLVAGPPDPVVAARLAVSAGRTLVRAAAAGLAMRDVRPELMWAESSGTGIEVVGISARTTELFRRRRSELPSHPLFEDDYQAPEPGSDPRSIAFSLAAMTVRWATGRVARAGDEVADVAEPLASLLRRALRAQPEARPTLQELVETLAVDFVRPAPG